MVRWGPDKETVLSASEEGRPLVLLIQAGADLPPRAQVLITLRTGERVVRTDLRRDELLEYSASGAAVDVSIDESGDFRLHRTEDGKEEEV